MLKVLNNIYDHSKILLYVTVAFNCCIINWNRCISYFLLLMCSTFSLLFLHDILTSQMSTASVKIWSWMTNFETLFYNISNENIFMSLLYKIKERNRYVVRLNKKINIITVSIFFITNSSLKLTIKPLC